MDTEARGFPRGEIRVSDAERDQALAELSEHFQTGRLTQDEFDERSGLALKARTGHDLTALFGDLPRRPVVPVAPAGQFPGFSAGTAATPLPDRPQGGWLLPTARGLFVFAILAMVAGTAAGGHHHSFGWIIPFVIVGLVVLRVLRHRR
jgi:hypothetical protein